MRQPAARRLQRAAAAAVAVTALTLAVAGCGGGDSGTKVVTVDASAAAVPPGAGRPVTNPQPAADFALRDQRGDLIRLSALRGKTVVIAFLYTQCPDVCPLIAESLNQALRDLGPARKDVRVLGISVDPEGDTPSAVRSFAAIHRLLPQFHYLTGTRAELEQVWKDYFVAVADRDDPIVDHSAYELLVDAEGIGRIRYDSEVRPEAVVSDIKALAAG